MPAKAIIRKVKAAATQGERLASPDHWSTWVASVPEERTRATMAKAGMVMKP